MEAKVAGSVVRVAAAVIRRGDCVLLTQRPPGGPLGGQWEFPGGKLEPGETAAAAIVRELHEELGVTATVSRELHVERHAYAHGLEVEITFLDCTLSGEPAAGPGIHAMRWVRPAEIDVATVLEADRAFVERLARP
jgi:mutator protein MutT